ncbi:vacuolar sorting protein VPS33/slp1 [Boothiomyces macroporosus]|uniref:Vacuolar sorting protein VPS33/slp1 n=1 Tax=Boothiomyces macroporosus TaxID=261099 RepID=A0AAD5UJR2_9FUNG|nr:vacuolar sorting protein VPS33/slp1 [Boothiomyces macroporosus]
MTLLKQIPNIKYFDPNGAGTNLAARAAWKVYQKAEELEEAKEEWSADNITADLLIIDRSVDTLTPILHNLHYQAIIQDLFYVENGKKLHLPTDEIRDEKVYDLSDKDQFFMKLRHLYLGDVGEEIAKFIAENPAANEYYNGGTAALGDKVYSLGDAQKIQQHSVIFDALCKAYQENKLDTIVELEQNLATGESSKTGAKISAEIVQEVLETIANPTINIDDKLRLLLACHHRFPVADVQEESVRDLAMGGFSGLDVLRSGKKIPNDDSDPMWKYTYEGWKSAMQAKGRTLPPENEEIITRFKPTLHRLIDDYLNNWFSPVFSSVEEEIVKEEEILERGNGSVIPFTKGFVPSWGRMKPENPDVEEFVDLLKNGRRVIIFVLGGMSIPEIQLIHESISVYRSTNLITPNIFANDLCRLGENDSGIPRLLSPIKPLLKQELDLRNKKKLKLLAEQERLKQEEEDALEAEKQKELRRLQSQMQRVNIEEGRQRRLQEALADADDGLGRNDTNAYSKYQPIPRSMSPSNVSLDRGPGYASMQQAVTSDPFQNVSYASKSSYFSPPYILPPPILSTIQPSHYSSISHSTNSPATATPYTPSAANTDRDIPNIIPVKTDVTDQNQVSADEKSATSTVFTKMDEKVATPTNIEPKNIGNDQISRTTSIKSLDSISCPSESARRENSTSSGERKVDVKKLFQRPTVIRKKSDKLTKMALKYRELAANSTKSESKAQFENFIPPTPSIPQAENPGNQRFPQRRVVPASATRVPNSGRNLSHDSYSDGNSPYSQNSPNSTHSSHPNLPYNQPQTTGYSDYSYGSNLPSPPPPVRRQVYAPPQGPNWTQTALGQGGPPQLLQRQPRPPPPANYQSYFSPNRPEPPSPQQYQSLPPQQYPSPNQYQPPINQYRNNQPTGYDNRGSHYDNRGSVYDRSDNRVSNYDNRATGYDNRNSQYDRQQSNFYGNQQYTQYQDQYRPPYDNFNRQSPGPDQYRYHGYPQPPEGRPQEPQGFVPPGRGPYRPGQYQPRPPI